MWSVRPMEKMAFQELGSYVQILVSEFFFCSALKVFLLLHSHLIVSTLRTYLEVRVG